MKLFVKIFLYLVAFFVFFGIEQTIGGIISGTTFNEMIQDSFDSDPYQMMLMEIFGCVFTIILTWLFLRFDKESLKVLGLRLDLNLISQGTVLGGIFVWLFFIILLFFDQIELNDHLIFNEDFIYISVALFFAAFIEEIVFRGYIFTKFYQQTGKIKALIFSSLIFAAFHLLNPNLSWIAILEIFLAGAVIGFAYLKTGNIWFVTFLHWSWNLVQTIIGYNVSGQDFYSVLNFAELEKNIWTGGNFGFEGSILSVISMFLMYFLLTKIHARKSTF